MDAILLTAPDGNVFFANQAACNLFQMAQQEITDGGRIAVLDEKNDRLPKALEAREKTENLLVS
jgi:PAS domain-containing protein